MTEQVWWYVARSSGIVALALLLGAVTFGLLMSTRLGARIVAVPWLLGVHRALGGLAVGFTGVHLAGLLLDDYVQFGVVDLLVPGASPWKPLAVAWGVVALYLLVAVQATALAMRRLPSSLWRAVHTSSFVLFWVAALHGLTAGTDATAAWFRWPLVGAMSLIAGLTLARLAKVLRQPARPKRRPAGQATPRPATLS